MSFACKDDTSYDHKAFSFFSFSKRKSFTEYFFESFIAIVFYFNSKGMQYVCRMQIHLDVFRASRIEERREPAYYVKNEDGAPDTKSWGTIFGLFVIG